MTRRLPRGPVHPAWFFVLLWLAVAAVSILAFLLGEAF